MMEDISYLRQPLDYRPTGRRERRRPARSLKRLPDGYSREVKTGHLLA